MTITNGSAASSTTPNTEVSHGPRNGLRNFMHRDVRSERRQRRAIGVTGKKALRPWDARRTSLIGVTPRVLVVEDDPTVREITRRYLGDAGYVVDEAADGPAGLRSARTDPPDAVVLDLMLPGTLRPGGVPGAARPPPGAADRDAVRARQGGRPGGGLELGADDYVTKPFSARELVLRVGVGAASGRRAGRGPGGPLVDGDLRVDPSARRRGAGDADLPLTGREFDLLAFLLAHPGRAYTRAELLAQVWGWEFGDQSTVTVHVRRLREKIEDDPTQPRRIATIWGTGYRYDPRPCAEMITRRSTGCSRRRRWRCCSPCPSPWWAAWCCCGCARRSLTATMVALVLVPLVAALVGVLGRERVHVHAPAGRHRRGRAWSSPR